MTDTSSGKILAQTEVIAAKGTSAWSLFWEADIFVQFIMLLLVIASIWSWNLILQKIWQFKSLKRSTNAILGDLSKIHSLSKLKDFFNEHPHHVMHHILWAGLSEISEVSHSEESKKNSISLVSQSLESALRWQIHCLQRSTTFLATVGSTAPFIGLLGTVWGIMHSFQSIAMSQNTNLAVVAPGIAEALAATALGLLTAIPAVVAYNRINTFLSEYTQLLEHFVDKVCILYSKEIY
ncbi:MAG: MotA/TolQ/ExbB proton channel family protein [Alphaproteobacteria bacterium]